VKPLDKKVAIIATYGRSGSTLLSAILSSVAGFHMAGENGDAMRGLFHSVKALRKAQSKAKHFKTNVNEPWYLIDKINITRYGELLLESFFSEIVMAPAECNGKFGFKEIRFFKNLAETTDYLEFLLEFIPSVKIIFNIRSHQAVSRSGWYRKMDSELVAKRLAAIDEQMFNFTSHHTDKAIICSYDEYIANPESLRRLFNFLNEPYDATKIAEVLATPLSHGKRDSGKPAQSAGQ